MDKNQVYETAKNKSIDGETFVWENHAGNWYWSYNFPDVYAEIISHFVEVED